MFGLRLLLLRLLHTDSRAGSDQSVIEIFSVRTCCYEAACAQDQCFPVLISVIYCQLLCLLGHSDVLIHPHECSDRAHAIEIEFANSLASWLMKAQMIL